MSRKICKIIIFILKLFSQQSNLVIFIVQLVYSLKYLYIFYHKYDHANCFHDHALCFFFQFPTSFYSEHEVVITHGVQKHDVGCKYIPP